MSRVQKSSTARHIVIAFLLLVLVITNIMVLFMILGINPSLPFVNTSWINNAVETVHKSVKEFLDVLRLAHNIAPGIFNTLMILSILLAAVIVIELIIYLMPRRR